MLYSGMHKNKPEKEDLYQMSEAEMYLYHDVKPGFTQYTGLNNCLAYALTNYISLSLSLSSLYSLCTAF